MGKATDDEIEAEVEGEQISKPRRVRMTMNVEDDADTEDTLMETSSLKFAENRDTNIDIESENGSINSSSKRWRMARRASLLIQRDDNE